MTSALIVSTDPHSRTALAADFDAAGIHVHGAIGCDTLVREAVRQAPDVVVCWEPAPTDAFFQAVSLLAASSPAPVALFTEDPEVATIERALRAGIQEIVVRGYAPARLRSVLHTAMARFRHERELREALADITSRFEERKLVDRAKGILMKALRMTEEEAFRALRTQSMHNNQRLGLLARQVIDGARSAEAVNRAGQLRMLSQRIVKLQALLVCGHDVEPTKAMLASSIERVEHTLALLHRQLSEATLGDLLKALLSPWAELKALLDKAPHGDALVRVDAQAEQLLGAAERLTCALEATGGQPTLAVVNLCGRQRMLSQRLAKQALLSFTADGEAARHAQSEAPRTMDAFENALKQLRQAPLSTQGIREALEASTQAWHELLSGAAQAGSAPGRAVVARASENLLDLFETLTARYEHSLQVLTGSPELAEREHASHAR